MARASSRSLLAVFRRAQVPTARAVTALFAVAWLGLAIQPCAAMSQGQAVEQGSHSGHAGHGGHAGDDGRTSQGCPHCPSSTDGAGHPGTALACDAIGLPAMPSKNVDTPQPDLFVAIVGTAGSHPVVAPASVNRRLTEPPRRHPPSTSLRQRYCSYLK